MKKLFTIFFATIIIGMFIGSFFILFSRDVSLNYSVWLKLGQKEAYNLNDYVIFKYTKPDKYFENKKLIKQVVCVEGQKLATIDHYITCDNKIIAQILEKDKEGNRLPYLKFNQVIPKGYYFLAGTHERSYDSRYFGLIKHEEIQEELIPIRSILLW